MNFVYTTPLNQNQIKCQKCQKEELVKLYFITNAFKGTVSVISSDPPCRGDNDR